MTFDVTETQIHEDAADSYELMAGVDAAIQVAPSNGDEPIDLIETSIDNA